MKEKVNPDLSELCICEHDMSLHLDGENCSVCNCLFFTNREYSEEELKEDIGDIIKSLSSIEKSEFVDLNKYYEIILASISVLQIHGKRIVIKLGENNSNKF